MITVPNNFTNAVTQTSRQFRARILCNGTALSGNVASFTLYKGASGDQILPGAVYIPYMEASIRGCSTSVEGITIVLQIGIVVDHDANGDPIYSDWVQLGSYIATKPMVTADTLSFKAVANLGIRGGVSYTSALTYPASISSVISEIATQLSTTISLKGLTATGSIETSMSGILLRDALGYVAGILGGFATEDSTGGIVISKYGAGDTLAVDPWRSQRQPEFAEGDWTCTGIKVVVSEDSEDEEGTVIPGVSYSHGTPNVIVSNPYMTQALFNVMYPNIEGVSLSPCEIDMQIGEPRLEPWDKLAITDLAGDDRTVFCLTLIQRYHGGFESSVEAEISTETETSAETTGPITKGLMQAISDADAAKTAASEAATAASDARHEAEGAAEAAESALESAGQAAEAASSAESDASEASSSAKQATKYANTALGQLSEVEKVVDVLSWAAEHGDYDLTADDEVVAGKFYFTRSGSGTDADPYVYTVVTDPQDDPATAGYYELTGVDEAISNYVNTHLALTDDGLFVQMDDNACKLQITSTGILLYDTTGTVIAEYGGTITLGDATGLHITLSSGELGFWQGATKVAYINQNKLYITQSEVTTDMKIGSFLWKRRSATRVSLVYSG